MEEVIATEEPPQLIPAVATFINDPRHAQQLLGLANQMFPFNETTDHLKRIRKADVRQNSALPADNGAVGDALELIVVAGEKCHMMLSVADIDLHSEGGTHCAAALGSLLSDFTSAVEKRCTSELSRQLAYHLVQVPDRSPRQFPASWLSWTKIWPLAHPKPRPVAIPTEEDVVQSTEVMRQTIIPMCRQMANLPGCLPIFAAVIDPTTNQVVVTSEGCPTMQLDDHSACSPYLPTTVASPTALTGRPLVLEHPVMFVLKRLSLHQQEMLHGGKDDDGREATNCEEDGVDRSQPYLANTLDVYVSHEPCVMCAMALVHSRIRRVYYCIPNEAHGGLGSAFHVHAIPSLNHHYRVFHCTRGMRMFEEEKWWQERLNASNAGRSGDAMK